MSAHKKTTTKSVKHPLDNLTHPLDRRRRSSAHKQSKPDNDQNHVLDVPLVPLPASHTLTLDATAALVISEPDTKPFTGLSGRTMQRLRLEGCGPSFIQLTGKKIGYRVPDLQEWVAQRVISGSDASVWHVRCHTAAKVLLDIVEEGGQFGSYTVDEIIPILLRSAPTVEDDDDEGCENSEGEQSDQVVEGVHS